MAAQETKSIFKRAAESATQWARSGCSVVGGMVTGLGCGLGLFLFTPASESAAAIAAVTVSATLVGHAVACEKHISVRQKLTRGVFWGAAGFVVAGGFVGAYFMASDKVDEANINKETTRIVMAAHFNGDETAPRLVFPPRVRNELTRFAIVPREVEREDCAAFSLRRLTVDYDMHYLRKSFWSKIPNKEPAATAFRQEIQVDTRNESVFSGCAVIDASGIPSPERDAPGWKTVSPQCYVQTREGLRRATNQKVLFSPSK